MIEAKFVSTDDELKHINKISQQVLGITNDISSLNNLLYVLVYESNKPVGYGKLVIDNETVISQVAVIEDYRRKYIGDLIVKMLLDKVFQIKKEVYVYSSNSSLKFFKSIGFESIEKSDNTTKMLIKKDLIKKQCKK